MSRTRGAKDRKIRKIRSDRVHIYRHKHGKLVRYVSKRQRGDPIKLYFWEEKDMSRDSIMQWHKKLRDRVKKTVFIPLQRVDIEPSRIKNEEEIKALAIEVIGYPGKFIMRGFSHGKTIRKCKQVRLAVIVIKETEEGFNVKVSDTWRLKMRYKWLYHDI